LPLDNAHLAALWAGTIALMNWTFNCFIFYWKNMVLRTSSKRPPSGDQRDAANDVTLLLK
jgi:hypothetical protein